MNISEHYRELALQPGAAYEEIVRSYRWRMLVPIDRNAGPSGETRRQTAIAAFVALRKVAQPRRKAREFSTADDPLSHWRESEVFRFQRTPFRKTDLHFAPAKAPVLAALGNSSPPPAPPIISPQAHLGSTMAIAAGVVAALLIVLNLRQGKEETAFPATAAPTGPDLVATAPAVPQPSVPPPTPATPELGRIVVRANRPGVVVELTRVGESHGAATGTVADGSREFTGLAIGDYRLVAQLEGWPPLTRTVTAMSGKPVETAFEFRSGSIRLESDPPNAVVKSGSNEIGKTPLVVSDLPPGTQTFTLQYDWWPAVWVTRTILEHKELKVAVRMPRGRLTVSSSPTGATVLAGDRELGKTPLVVEAMPAGQHKLLLRAAEYQPAEAAVSIADGGELKISPVLVSSLPVLVPNDVINVAWSDNASRTQRQSSQGSVPRNGVVKNLDRQSLDMLALGRRFRFSSAVKGYDPKSGRLEFMEEDALKSRYRVIAQLSAAARSNPSFTNRLLKGAVVEVSGVLSAVEEPRWPSKVIVLELDQAAPTN